MNKRIIVQIIKANAAALFALCNDGSVWIGDWEDRSIKWTQVSSVYFEDNIRKESI